MNNMKVTIATVLLLLLGTTNLYAQSDSTFIMEPLNKEAFEVMRLFFSYDKDVPLDAVTMEKKDETGYTYEKIIFNSVHENRVPGILAIPKAGNAPYPCVLLLHGAGKSKESWWTPTDEYNYLVAQPLISAGYAVLMLDAKYFGDRKSENENYSPSVFIFQKHWKYIERDVMVQTTIDYRRAIDYLETRPEINATKIGAIGSSMGAMMTFFLTGVEPRVKVAVAKATPNIRRKYSANSPYNFASAIKSQPFLMLMGKSDPNSGGSYATQQLYNLVSSPTKNLILYDSGHMLPDEWKEEAVNWIKKYLK